MIQAGDGFGYPKMISFPYATALCTSTNFPSRKGCGATVLPKVDKGTGYQSDRPFPATTIPARVGPSNSPNA